MRLSHFRQYYSNCHMIYYTIFNFQTTAVYVKKWSPVLYQSHQPRSRPLSIKWPESFDDFTIDNLDVVILQLVYQYIYGAFSRFCICVWTFCGGHSSPPAPRQHFTWKSDLQKLRPRKKAVFLQLQPQNCINFITLKWLNDCAIRGLGYPLPIKTVLLLLWALFGV